jgi:hypothetical protein
MPTNSHCANCIELTQQLKEAWETILRLDGELKIVSGILTMIEAERHATVGPYPGEHDPQT